MPYRARHLSAYTCFLALPLAHISAKCCVSCDPLSASFTADRCSDCKESCCLFLFVLVVVYSLIAAQGLGGGRAGGACFDMACSAFLGLFSCLFFCKNSLCSVADDLEFRTWRISFPFTFLLRLTHVLQTCHR